MVENLTWDTFYLKYLTFFLITLFGLWGLGRTLAVVRQIFHKQKINLTGNLDLQDLFFSISAGLFTSVVIFALYATGGKTIFLVGGLSLCCYLSYRPNDRLSHHLSVNKPSSWSASVLALMILMAFSWEAFYILKKSGTQPFIVPHHDYIFWARIADGLFSTGQENVYHFGNYISNDYHGIVPYHYFELYFAGGIARVYGLNTLLCLHLLFYPICTTLIILGIGSLLSYFNILRAYTFALSSLLLFCASHTQAIFYQWEPLRSLTTYFFMYSAILSQPLGKKLLPLYCVGFLCLLLYLVKRRLSALVVLVFAPLVSITILPAVWGGLAFFVGLNLRYGWLDKKSIYKLIGIWGVVIFSFAFIFLLWRNPGLATQSLGNAHFSLIDKLTNTLQVLATTSLQSVVMYALMLIFLVWSVRKWGMGQMAVLGFCILGVGLMLRGVADRIFFDSEQLFKLPESVILKCALAYYFALALAEYGKLRKLPPIILIVCIFYFAIQTRRAWINLIIPYFLNIEPSTYSDAYILALQKHLPAHPVGVCFFSTKDYKANLFNQNTFLKTRAEFLPMLFENQTLIPGYQLSVFDIQPDKESPHFITQKYWLQSSAFYRFVANENQRGANPKDLPALQLAFIQKYQCNYITTTATATLPGLLRQALPIQLVATDAHSGEKFYIITRK